MKEKGGIYMIILQQMYIYMCIYVITQQNIKFQPKEK